MMRTFFDKLSPIFSFFGKYYLVFLLAFCVHRQFKVVEHPSRTRLVLYSDAEGYYIYLTAFFMNGGFKDLYVRSTSVFTPHPASGKIFTKYTSGVALLEMPFFLAAHTLAEPLGFERDGYSEIYVRAILLAALCYAFLGLFFLKRVLEKKFSKNMVCIALVTILFGSNLFHYIIDAGGMSHAYSFFLFSVFIYLTPKVYENPSAAKVFLFGLILGWIILIRPTNVILVLYPIFYNISSKKDWQERWNFILKNFPKIVFLLLGMFLIFIPQFLYWKDVLGTYIAYTYTDEAFIYWKNPQVWNLWFSPRNGWLIYSPVMIAPVIGLLWGWKANKNNHLLIFTIFAIATYLLSSWWCWWFGGALGQRSYVEYYSLLSIPLAWMLERSFQKKKVVFVLLLTFLVWGIDVGLKMNRFHRGSLITSDEWYDWEKFQEIWKYFY